METVFSPIDMKYITSCANIHDPTLNHHHVALVTSRKCGGRVLASGTNCATRYGSIHAEIGALRQFKKRLKDKCFDPRELDKGVCVWSLRVTNAGVLRLARPCNDCHVQISMTPYVREVAWSTQDGDIVCDRV